LSLNLPGLPTYVIEFAIAIIRTEQDLANFVDATEQKIAQTTGRVRDYLREIETRVLAAF
jgi:hypothetical protein